MVGRDKEIQLLQEALRDDASHFVAVYGRRRVGKTYLIRETFDYRFTFQHAGVSAGGKKEQLQAFSSSLKDAGYVPKKKITNWLDAFDGLKDVVRQSTEQKKIIFIDELSWMDSQKSDLMAALENFWNGFASARKDILLIVCASATSWMLSKVVHNKGGLYHRLTEQIHLQPFALKQCEDYVKSVGLALNRDQILQYYAIFGGVPYYWSFLKKGLSLSQNVDAILFTKDAPLRDEFQYLYAAIFRKPEIYVKIIETLATKKSGMTRTELIDAARITNSGDLTVKLEELESCGFIRKYQAFGRKKKSAVYQLMDFFTLFYYQFLKEEPTDEHFWTNQLNTPARNVWMGIAFERICLAHVDQIKKALGISGVLTQVNSWYCNADLEHGIFGSQVDLLIVRKDQVINLCEMKYSVSEYTITEKTSQDMNRKISDLVAVTGTKYAIYPTWITTYGLVHNAYASDVQSVITMEDLFQDV
jgi:AAA+ ATPase superfamily predicted ATPase